MAVMITELSAVLVVNVSFVTVPCFELGSAARDSDSACEVEFEDSKCGHVASAGITSLSSKLCRN